MVLRRWDCTPFRTLFFFLLSFSFPFLLNKLMLVEVHCAVEHSSLLLILSSWPFSPPHYPCLRAVSHSFPSLPLTFIMGTPLFLFFVFMPRISLLDYKLLEGRILARFDFLLLLTAFSTMPFM